MKLIFHKHTNPKVIARTKKKIRVRRHVKGTAERPRLSVYRSAKHIYAQLVDDTTGITLMSASTLTVKAEDKNGKDAAFTVGQTVGKMAKEKNIQAIVFDRNGYLYHGRVKALADGAREAGLNF